MTIPTSLSNIVGANARAIRLAAGKTLDDLALAARQYGAPWTTGTVGGLEGGIGTTSLKNLLLLSAALSDITGDPVTIADLCSHTGTVRVTSLCLDAAALTDALTGKPAMLEHVGTEWSRESEERILRKLGFTVEEARPLMVKLWGHGLIEERNRRAGTEANAQKRGRITQVLKSELQIAHRLIGKQ